MSQGVRRGRPYCLRGELQVARSEVVAAEECFEGGRGGPVPVGGVTGPEGREQSRQAPGRPGAGGRRAGGGGRRRGSGPRNGPGRP